MATQKLHKLEGDEYVDKKRAQRLNKKKRNLERRNRRKMKQAGIYL